MLTKSEVEEIKKRVMNYLSNAGMAISDEEYERIEIADLGLGQLEQTGLQLLTYVNTERCCAKELILFPHQTCPEHKHPSVNGEPGKEETFRCRWGEVYLYVEGLPEKNPKAVPPAGKADTYTVWHEIILTPGMQYTLYPNIKHWFQAGSHGAVVSEFSTRSRDELDIFTDKAIKRTANILE